jgi:hypothetical protein
VILQSYHDMGTEGRRRLRKIGGAMLAFGVGLPMLIEPFIALSWVYWTFAGFVALAGLCLLWPEAGFVLLDRIVSAAARLIPAIRGLIRPERRTDGNA